MINSSSKFRGGPFLAVTVNQATKEGNHINEKKFLKEGFSTSIQIKAQNLILKKTLNKIQDDFSEI